MNAQMVRLKRARDEYNECKAEADANTAFRQRQMALIKEAVTIAYNHWKCAPETQCDCRQVTYSKSFLKMSGHGYSCFNPVHFLESVASENLDKFHGASEVTQLLNKTLEALRRNVVTNVDDAVNNAMSQVESSQPDIEELFEKVANFLVPRAFMASYPAFTECFDTEDRTFLQSNVEAILRELILNDAKAEIDKVLALQLQAMNEEKNRLGKMLALSNGAIELQEMRTLLSSTTQRHVTITTNSDQM